MPKCVMVLPWKDGSINIDTTNVTGWVVASYAPPPADLPQYVLVWLEAPQTVIDTLTARSDCLYICSRTSPLVDANGNVTSPGNEFETATINATQRNAVRAKIQAMGFTGAQFGLLNAAIQSSQNRHELAYALATKAFHRDRHGNKMTDQDVRGTYQ